MSQRSYLLIYNAHSGDLIRAPKPIRSHKLIHFKEYISDKFEFEDPESIFLLTSFGIKLDFNIINEITEVYCYDRKLFSEEGLAEQLKREDEQKSFPPLKQFEISRENLNLANMTSRIRTYHDWTLRVYKEATASNSIINSLIQEINIIFKGLNVLFQFAANFIHDVEKSFNSSYNYVKVLNAKSLLDTWQNHLRKLERMPAVKVSTESFKLSEFLDRSKLKRSSEYIEANFPQIKEKFSQLGEDINSVTKLKVDIDDEIKQLRETSMRIFKDNDASAIYKSIEDVRNSLAADVIAIKDQIENDPQVIYHKHTDISMVQLNENLKKQYSLHVSLVKFQYSIKKSILKIFHDIAVSQMKVVKVKNELKWSADSQDKDINSLQQAIEKLKKSEDVLSLTIDLPLLFGLMLVEKRRQFEWYDFFRKGVVNNVSEQISIILDQEKLFRKLWIKKFGFFLDMLGDTKEYNQYLPNIDVTLIGSKAELFTMVENLTVERDDIQSYLVYLKDADSPSKFIDLITTSYNDLLRSTNNMKKVTRAAGSLSTYNTSSQSGPKVVLKEEEAAADSDLSTTKGLRARIHKLENLLHQQQYQDLNKWPVTRPNEANGQAVKSSLLLKEPNNQLSTNLLSKRPPVTLQRALLSSNKPLNSGNIDEHLDDFRLTKEVPSLPAKNERPQIDNGQAAEETEQHRNELAKQTLRLNEEEARYRRHLTEVDEEIKSLRAENTAQRAEISFLKDEAKIRDDKFTQVQSLVKDATTEKLSLRKELADLKAEYELLQSKHSEAESMKRDLLSNLSSKEVEVGKERTTFESEIETLKKKHEEVTEDYENLLELSTLRQKNNEILINDLNNTILSLFMNIKRIMDTIFDYFVEFCLILESIGLLLIYEDDCFKIIRVKGLRSKKSESNGQTESYNANSKAVDQIIAHMSWLSEISSLKSILPDNASQAPPSSDDDDLNRFNQQSLRLISVFNVDFNSYDSPFEAFMKAISFKENVVLHSGLHDRFFLNAIEKRFSDVEGYAKKLSKESKANNLELARVTSKLKGKISMSNFETNDLILFLPTRAEGFEDTDSTQPWAAFNVGAPHYFLKIKDSSELENKVWMVGRASNIRENRVTASNVEDLRENPFKLAIGITWYVIDATREAMA